jgi:hypothetical protein
MPRSITKTRKRRGRPFVGATPIQVRMPPTELANLDGWIARQAPAPSRPEAIRRLVDRALAGKGVPRRPNKEARRKAAQMAAREIDQLGDHSATGAERETRKRRLVSGPKEFRDLRGDQPKTKA